MTTTRAANRAVATRFIEAFNTNDWDTVREVVADEFVFHHPEGGTVAAGPEGMVAAWSAFKAAVPDGWHPIPVLIAEGDFVANLLPTYGHFTGKSYHGVPTTGDWLEYGMVNIARLHNGKIVEAWFGMDALAEKQQMRVAPPVPQRELTDAERANIKLFRRGVDDAEYDTITAFGDIVVALGPPQYVRETKLRRVEIRRMEDGEFSLIGTHEFFTIPSYPGDLSANTEVSRAVVSRLVDEVYVGHALDALSEIFSEHVLIHATAMPCEATHYGIAGVRTWLDDMWTAFPDLTIDDYATVAEGDIVAVRYQAHGTSQGKFLDLEPTGKPVRFTGGSMYRIAEGKIAEIWDARNSLAIVMQLDPNLARADHHH